VQQIGIAVVGCGYWGPNLIRNFVEEPRAQVRWVCDLDTRKLESVRRRYPSVRTTTQCDEVLADPQVEAIAIATPVHTHHTLARAALRAGKHLLVEKPLTDQAALAEDLVAQAQQHERILLVDHTFVYTGAVRYLKRLYEDSLLGDLWYIDSVRINLGLFQHDVNVVWDLAPHDLSIVTHLIGKDPLTVQATGACHTGNHVEDVAYLTLDFGQNLIAHFHVNWLSPVKVRHMIFGGRDRMVIFNDLEPSEKLRIYDRGIEVKADNHEGIYNLLVNYRSGDMWVPALDGTEALQVEIGHFLDCIERGEQPITGGEAGLRVVKILEAAQMSIKAGGKRVAI
jgi:predicted dehydrogenase